MKEVDKMIYDYLRSNRFRLLLESKEDEMKVDHPVTMTYALERLIITHVKLFMMEDQVRDETLTDAGVGSIKRKIDYWNGKVRPRLINALGDMLAEAVLGKNEDVIKEPDMKDYKAR